MIRITLTDSDLENSPITECNELRSDDDWVVIQDRTESNIREYRSYGGPHNLEEMITRFLEWTSNAEPKATP